MAVYAMFGVLMLTSKILMEAVPNVHLLGIFTMLLTVVYRRRALYPIYTYVLLNGVYAGFASWWLPYLYIWTVLWGVVMLLPKNMPRKAAAVVYPLVCALHGLAFGTLYAPLQALMYGYDWRGMLTWISLGFPMDVLHAVGNLAAGLLILPLSDLLRKLNVRFRIGA